MASSSIIRTNVTALIKRPIITATARVRGPIGPEGPTAPNQVLKDTIFYNVLDHGAVGDDTTDDAAAIQTLINTVSVMSPSGGWITGPAKTYLLGSAIQVKSNIKFSFPQGTTFRLKNNSGINDNIIKAENQTNFIIEGFTVDGNKANQSGTTQYGIYIAGCTNGLVKDIFVKNTTGVGIHSYNNTGTMFESLWSTGNTYHGFEIEQSINCSFNNIRGYSNTLHGLLVSPGEIGGSGSKGNNISNFTFDSNAQYGIAFNAANADMSPWLCEGNKFTNGNVTNNSQYGINLYKQDKASFINVYVAYNGYFGIYAFQSASNIFNGITLHNNSQAANNAYDEIFLEGASGGHASTSNLFTDIKIIVDGTNKARYAINEAATGDSNTYTEVSITGTPVTGTRNISVNTRYGHVDLTTIQTIGGTKTFTNTIGATQGLSVAPNAALSGTVMGIDAPFGTAALRLYNSNTGGNLQFVSPNGNSDWYAGGNNTFSATSSFVSTHGYPLQDLPAPSNPNDAVRKSYVDTVAGNYVLKAGDTMTGPLIVNNALIRAIGPTTAGGTDVLSIESPAAFANGTGRLVFKNTAGSLTTAEISAAPGTTFNASEFRVRVADNTRVLRDRFYIDFAGNIGIGTAAPTHSLTMPSTSTGIRLYNTTISTTDYERGGMYWLSNVLTFAVDVLGTGTARNMQFIANGNTVTLAGVAPTMDFSRAATATSKVIRFNAVSLTSSTATQVMTSTEFSTNQTGTAGYTAHQILVTETGIGSGTKLLADWQVGGVSRFSISSAGDLTIAGSVTTSSVVTVTATGTIAATTYMQRVNSGSNTNQTLPPATLGKQLVVKNMNSGVVTLIGTVDGVVNPTLATQYKYYSMIGNGTTWDIIGNN